MKREPLLEGYGIFRAANVLIPNLPTLVGIISFADPLLEVRAYYRWAGNGLDVQVIHFEGEPPVSSLDAYAFAHAAARLRCEVEEYGITVSAKLLDEALHAMEHSAEWKAYWAAQARATEAELDREVARERSRSVATDASTAGSEGQP